MFKGNINLSVYILTFDQFNACLLSKTINLFKKKLLHLLINLFPYFICVSQANLKLQEARLTVAQDELTKAQEQLDSKQRELDEAQVWYICDILYN